MYRSTFYSADRMYEKLSRMAHMPTSNVKQSECTEIDLFQIDGIAFAN